MDFDSDRVTVVNTNPNFTGAAPVVDESLFEKERARNSFRYVCLGGGMVDLWRNERRDAHVDFLALPPSLPL